MESLVEFDINHALKLYKDDPFTVPTADADGALFDCEHDPETLTGGVVNGVLNPIVDAVAESPDAIARSSIFDSLQFLLKHSTSIPASSLSKALDLIISGIVAEADVVHNDLESEEQDAIQHQKRVLEMYGFLLQWALTCVDAKSTQEKSMAPVARKGLKGAKSKANIKDAAWDPSSQIQAAFEAMVKVMRLKLSRIFVATSERDTFISLFTRPVYLLLENETRVKNTGIRMHSFRVLCIAVKHHGHAAGAQTSIDQCLSYFEHLSEPMAEFLHILADQYDHPQLAEEVLKELSNKEFNGNDLKGPKSVSTFIARLSELAPRLVIKQVMLLAKLLDSESYTLRCAIIEVCGNLIAMLSKQEDEERGENHKGQMNAFFDVLEERFLDINPYCRCRAVQVYIKLCDLETKYPKRRQTAAELATRSLEDKSSNVRRNAAKLIGKLISTHPFSVLHGGQLSYSEWNARLEACEAELDTLKPPPGTPGLAEKEEKTVDEDLLDDATRASPMKEKEAPPMTEEQKEAAFKKAAEEAANAEMMNKLSLTRRYYVEALKFIEVVHEATPLAIQLLGSKNKSEVIEAMDLFVIADAYKIETARAGIRRMLRLIWTKGNSDEGKGVQTHLIECYKGLFFDAPDHFAANDAANYVARNMISLTFGATSAELTSLEQLLSTMMKSEMINDTVVQKLWQVYGVQKKEISKTQRRGAIIVLGMLSLADPEIIVKEMETCLRIGLGRLGREDLGLARYTCIALTRMNATKQTKGMSAAPSTRLDNDHAVLQRLAAITQVQSTSKEWFGLAEQAIGAIYALSKHPDVLCSEIVKVKTKAVFSPAPPAPQQSSPVIPDADGMDVDMMDVDAPEVEAEQAEAEVSDSPTDESSTGLSQLLFTVGHVAIKQIVHLELCEQDFKRRKAEKEKTTPKAAASPIKKGGKKGKDAGEQKEEEQDEMDLIAGTNEDDFTEAIQHVRERELLFGQQSLLSSFGPLVREICSNKTSYPNRDLQSQAALCMAKLMCVSGEYCEQNLALLITILERSHDATARSNLVVALGDMAVCFNHLIDENTDYLYRRLSDPSLPVKRTCLMTLTFLILAGQVKVKGQLGEMAKCVEDEDERIKEMSRMFFGELAGKDNAIYNHFVDMFSLLSADEGLEEDQFRKIIKFLSAFIEKDKHAKQLANKLAARLQRVESERQWNDVAYALGLLQHKDEEITKLVGEGYKTVQAAA
ncbi:Condensin complex subunit 1 [Elsinoe australis]|uniref:Condensin complex subunit 1 n=1 Tax=Elsinoe australis TaxID=40998 RepID=A0A2P8A923_9PEZI|nr:Condensin complex subunit 1 [Elsinoe australis]